MNQEIMVELQFFFISVLWGGIVLLAYDGLRVLHRLIKHGTFFLAVEDIIFWIAAGLFIFSMIYDQNNGIIRGFSVMGMSIGILLYHYLFKNVIVDIIVAGIRTLLRPIGLAFKAIRRSIQFILSKVKKTAKFLIRQLKKLLKSVKIAVNKSSQVLSAKRQIRIDRKAALRKNKVGKPDHHKQNEKKHGNESNQEAVPVNRPEPAYKREYTLIFERVNPVKPTQVNVPADKAVVRNIPAQLQKDGQTDRKQSMKLKLKNRS